MLMSARGKEFIGAGTGMAGMAASIPTFIQMIGCKKYIPQKKSEIKIVKSFSFLASTPSENHL